MHQTLMEMPTRGGVTDAPGSSQFICMADCDTDPSDVLKGRPIYMYWLVVLVMGPDE